MVREQTDIMVADSHSGAAPSNTVCFVVGGTRYEISRSLLERFPDTKLAQLVGTQTLKNSDAPGTVSNGPTKPEAMDAGEKDAENSKNGSNSTGGDTADPEAQVDAVEEQMKETLCFDLLEDMDSSGPKETPKEKCDGAAATTAELNREPIFIDRDGDRFRYVLDFMRDGKVILPYNSVVVTKESLLVEFQYFGFLVEDCANAIQVAPFPAYDSVQHLFAMEKQHHAQRVAEITRQANQISYKRKCLDFALYVFQQYRQFSKVQLLIYKDDDYFETVKDIFDMSPDDELGTYHQDCLNEFGLMYHRLFWADCWGNVDDSSKKKNRIAVRVKKHLPP